MSYAIILEFEDIYVQGQCAMPLIILYKGCCVNCLILSFHLQDMLYATALNISMLNFICEI